MKDRDQHVLALERWGAAIKDCVAALEQIRNMSARCAVVFAEFNEQVKAMNEEGLHEMPERGDR